MAVKQRTQIGLEDQWIEDPELLDLLERRQDAKAGIAAFRGLDKEAKGRILALELDGPRRCGRFLVSVAQSKPRSVSFDTDGGPRVSIKPVSDEE